MSLTRHRVSSTLSKIFMTTKESIDKLAPDTAKGVLTKFLDAYLNPAFGSIPKREVDILVFEILEEIGYTNEEPDLYHLVQQLRVTRSKARNLLYDKELRKLSTVDLDLLVKEAIKHPVIQKQGDLYALEIESPLVADHLRSKLKELKHTSDGSFSPTLVRLTKTALAALIESILTDAEKKKVKNALVKSGMPDGSLKGMLSGALKTVGKKIASDAGEQLAESAGDYLSPLIDASAEKVVSMFTGLFVKDEEEG
jgi:hypothetical protein